MAMLNNQMVLIELFPIVIPNQFRGSRWIDSFMSMNRVPNQS